MQTRTEQHTSTTTAEHPEFAPRRDYLTVKQFCQRNPAFTVSALHNLTFKASERESTKGKIPGNGLLQAGAIVRIGRKVLIVESRFFEWVEAQQRGESA